jgi:selenide, water dikinase
VLRPIENLFQAADYPDLLVGMDAPDDAAVWRLDEERALVVTTDFFTPVVDDPYDYGAIAAANSMSDVYAMGGQPFLALNVAALPPDLPPEIGAEIIRGGAEKAREAGVAMAGGHTIQDKEPKYGLIVVGFVDPRRMLTKGGARAGDVLVLTKPLGVGVTTTALKRGVAADEDVVEAVRWMKMLNRTASQLAVEFELKAGTDITGFSLLGHAFEMSRASGTSFRFSYHQIPLLEGARRYADLYTFPGGAADNRLYFQDAVRFADRVDDPARMLLFDPQTNGGLLLAVPSERLSDFLVRAAALDQPVWVVGEVLAGEGIEVR